MNKLLMGKIMEQLEEGKVRAIAVKFAGDMEEEEDYGKEEDTGDMCPKCGHGCPDDANYCPECGNDLNKEEMKEEKMEEKSGDNGGSNEEEMTDEEKNVMKLKEYSKKK